MKLFISNSDNTKRGNNKINDNKNSSIIASKLCPRKSDKIRRVPYCQTYHKEVSKMWGASNEELNELSAVVALTSFWSNVLHTQNYDYDTFVKELKQMGEYMTKNR
jgi:hypothetical protein